MGCWVLSRTDVAQRMRKVLLGRQAACRSGDAVPLLQGGPRCASLPGRLHLADLYALSRTWRGLAHAEGAAGHGAAQTRPSACGRGYRGDR